MQDGFNDIAFFLFMGFSVVFILAIIALPTVAAIFLNRWLKRKGFAFVGLFLLVAAPIWTAYETYTAIYPTDRFYLSEFEDITFRNAPLSSTIGKKDASYPNFHGEFCSAALITLSEEDYISLLNELAEDDRLEAISSMEMQVSTELKKVMEGRTNDQLKHVFRRLVDMNYLYNGCIGFLDDGRTIVISFCG